MYLYILGVLVPGYSIVLPTSISLHVSDQLRVICTIETYRDNKFWRMRLLYFTFVALLFTHCDARTSVMLSRKLSSLKNRNMKHLKILDLAKNLNMLLDVSLKDSSNTEAYVSSPFSLPPYDSLAPSSQPDSNNSPPFCVYPPPNPQTPSTTIPSPVEYNPTPSSSPPPSPIGVVPSPTMPEISPSPPSIVPGSPDYDPNPPYYEPSPPSGDIPSPPEDVPTPIGFEPSPPVFEPPVVYPPPMIPPSPSSSGGHGSGGGVWCVAKPSVPDPIIQEAMNYACGSGADCAPIQPNGQCFQPNTLLAHASYAFNSYWQRTKVAGGTCSFGGTAILVTVNPSSQGCSY